MPEASTAIADIAATRDPVDDDAASATYQRIRQGQRQRQR